ncbi:MAG: nuclear transport factor 2 family protein [Novosphingobium sp.]|jgi:ketosteroid isomerase-like protein|nr:nuclear transport factor 2 family protein [Novosphingobium sp.]
MIKRTAAELADAYLTALQAKDMNAMLALLAPDFTLEIPCNLSGTNDRSDSWTGIANAEPNYAQAFRMIEVLQYTDVEINQAANPSVAFLEGRGTMRMANGNPYNNRYVFRFDVDLESGKIRRAREYVNPVTFAVAMYQPLPDTAPPQ